MVGVYQAPIVEGIGLWLMGLGVDMVRTPVDETFAKWDVRVDLNYRRVLAVP